MMNTPRSGFNGYRKPPRNDEKAAKLITPRHVMNALRKWWLLAGPDRSARRRDGRRPDHQHCSSRKVHMASAWLKIESDQPFVAFPSGRTPASSWPTRSS